MDEFASILHRDYGLKPQGKSAPMTSAAAAAKSSVPSPFSSAPPNSVPSSIYRTSSAPKQKTGPGRSSSKVSNSESLDGDLLFGSSNGFSATKAYGSPFSDTPGTYDDVFGGPPKFATPSYPPMPSFASQQSSSSQSYDDIFRMPAKSSSSNSASFSKGSSFPVFDAPLYDDDIFGGVAGIRNAGVVYDDVFSGTSNVGTSPNVLEDLLGMSESKDRSSAGSQQQQPVSDSSTTSAKPSAFDDLLPGFGAKPTPTGAEKSGKSPHDGLDKNSLGMPPGDPFDGIHIDDPFDVQQFAGSACASDVGEPSLEPVKGSARSSSSRQKKNASRDDTSRDSSPHLFKARSPSLEKSHPSRGQTPSPTAAPSYTPFIETNSVSRSVPSSNGTAESKRDSNSPSPTEQSEAPPIPSPSKKGRQAYNDVEEPVHLPKAMESRQADEYWISVEDVKLVTEPTAMPPPSRRPPLPVMKHGHNRRRAPGARGESSFKGTSSWHDSPKSSKLSSSSIEAPDTSKKSTVNAPSNTYEELEQFASGVSKSRKDTKMDMSAPTLSEEILEGSAAVSASSMAMKEAMERARSKLWERGKEQRESGARSEGIQQGGKETKEEDEVNKVGQAEERQRIREREEKEREAKALREERDRRRREREKEKENEREREREREREKDRIAFERAAVERANAEARERLAAEVRQRAAAERAAADAREQAAAAEARERAAVEKVTAEARERAAAEARERAAAEAREKAAAERATAEARERAAAEARERVAAERAASEARARAERAFVERVHAEARERAAEKAAAEARERVTAERAAAEARERAAAAKEQHRRSENDLEAFFAASSRPASAPRQRSPVKGSSTDGRQVNKNFSSDVPQRASTAASGARKVTATTSNDDFASLFGSAVPPAGEFQEVEGESGERRKARWERHQRTAERAAKALDEKNQRDLQSQREQAERHRAGEVVDAEIKRWAAGKEGNLRALLSTLQYVLWPESGWQAVSLTDLITAAAVKKVYRKATLFVHPDKVQQKGATIHQKYVAEKVFDLLKEAWNKFNSEELF